VYVKIIASQRWDVFETQCRMACPCWAAIKVVKMKKSDESKKAIVNGA